MALGTCLVLNIQATSERAQIHDSESRLIANYIYDFFLPSPAKPFSATARDTEKQFPSPYHTGGDNQPLAKTPERHSIYIHNVHRKAASLEN